MNLHMETNRCYEWLRDGGLRTPFVFKEEIQYSCYDCCISILVTPRGIEYHTIKYPIILVQEDRIVILSLASDFKLGSVVSVLVSLVH